jgi:hypothetical protein
MIGDNEYDNDVIIFWLPQKSNKKKYLFDSQLLSPKQASSYMCVLRVGSSMLPQGP